ncbi:MAG: hypothetical protein AB1324_05605 [Candidatus Micrarchaeota archaeon]
MAASRSRRDPRAGARLPEARPDPPHWYAAFVFESSYAKPPSEEDLSLLRKAKERVIGAAMSAEKRKRLLDYLALGEGANLGRFPIVQTEAIANKYLDGAITEDHFDFEARLMAAWRSGKISGFIDAESVALDTRELSSAERRLAKKMLALAKTKSPIIMAIAVSSLRVYYSGADGEARSTLLSQAMQLVESAPDAEAQS